MGATGRTRRAFTATPFGHDHDTTTRTDVTQANQTTTMRQASFATRCALAAMAANMAVAILAVGNAQAGTVADRV
ncbi:MAG: hypothetical protein JWQ88_701, partial [Rhodoferax sp.]|nr:hypothetical protein [Rhodoferax sp.]